MKIDNFFGELKRRNVYKVAVAYAVVGWLLVQVATPVFPFFEIPNWGIRLVVLAIVVGFPIALVIAWAFETTPEGIKRTEIADAMPGTGGKKNLAWFGLGRYTAPNTSKAPDSSAKSIAVLAFTNLSNDKDNEYFSDGISEE